MSDKALDRRIEPPVISANRLVLRPFTPDDAPDVARLASDREIAATTLRIPHPYRLKDAREWIAGHPRGFEVGTGVHLAVTLRGDGALVGSIGLTIDIEHTAAELGYWIGKPYWGNGFATEASGEMIRYAFTTLGLHRVYAHHFARNAASGRVLEKVGMRREGYLRQHVRKWGEYHDCVFYGILATDV